MEFRQVVLVCHDFSIANNGTIQSYPAGQPDRLKVESRATRRGVFVERDPAVLGHWRVQPELRDAAGSQDQLSRDAAGSQDQLSSVTVSSAEELLAFLVSVWKE